MELIERDGKYFLQLIDGEIEIREEELGSRLENATQGKRIIEKGLDYMNQNPQLRNWDALQELESISRIDVWVETLIKVIEQFVREGKKEVAKVTLSLLIKAVSSKIANPLLTNARERNQYLKERLEEVKSFIELHEQLKASANTPFTVKDTAITQNLKLLLEQDPENIFCKPMPILDAIEHFSRLVKTKNMKGEPFLTQEAFEAFIQRAFLGDLDIEPQIINYNPNKEVGRVINVFHQFYVMAMNEYEPSANCLPKYISLLADNFQKWDYKKVKNNFSKQPSKPI